MALIVAGIALYFAAGAEFAHNNYGAGVGLFIAGAALTSPWRPK